MRKIITTLTAVTFALGLAFAAQAQTVKTPEKPEVKSEAQVGQPPATPKEATKPGEPAVKPGEKAAKEMKQGKKAEAKKMIKKGKTETQSQIPVEKSPGETK